MPTYEYECSAGHRYETREGFDAPATQRCAKCRRTARRVLYAPSIVFKGSGFYVTDSRKPVPAGDSDSQVESTPAASDAKAEPASAAGDSKAESTSADKKDSKKDTKKDAGPPAGADAPSVEAAAG